MLNNFQLNENRWPLTGAMLNQPLIPTITENSNNDIVFNGYGLQNSTIVVSQIDISSPYRELNAAQLPRSHGELYNSDYFRRKVITVYGRIFEASASALEDEIDRLKKILSQAEGNLDISLVTGGTKRRYIATLSNPQSMFSGRNHSDITTAPFTFQFTCFDGIARDIDFTDVSTSISSLVANTALYNTGTFENDFWMIFNLTNVTGITGILIENLTTQQSIQVTNALATGEILEIDGYEKEVNLNGSQLDFNGYFPKLALGENLIRITFSGTSISSVSLTTKYKNSYL